MGLVRVLAVLVAIAVIALLLLGFVTRKPRYWRWAAMLGGVTVGLAVAFFLVLGVERMF
jgi:hypothetical protein